MTIEQLLSLDGGHIVRWDDDMEPDEARGIGLELIRMADATDAESAKDNTHE